MLCQNVFHIIVLKYLLSQQTHLQFVLMEWTLDMLKTDLVHILTIVNNNALIIWANLTFMAV